MTLCFSVTENISVFTLFSQISLVVGGKRVQMK